MKKRKTGRTLSRTSDQRLALKRTMLTSLILHKRITTTLAKAKELKPFAERMVTKAKRVSDSSKGQAVLRLIRKDISSKAVSELTVIAKGFASRKGGYARILKLAPRKSDGAPMAIMEWVGMEKVVKKDELAKTGKLEEKEAKKSAESKKESKPSSEKMDDKNDKKQE